MTESGIYCLFFLLQRTTISEVITNCLLFEQILDDGYLENVKIRCLIPEPFLPENQVQTNAWKMCNLYLRIFCQTDLYADHIGWMSLSFYPHMLFTITHRILDCFINIKWKKSIFYSALNTEPRRFLLPRVHNFENICPNLP